MARHTKMAKVVMSIEVPEVDVVSCHAFSLDGSLLAFSPKNETIHIFRRQGPEYVRECVLAKHTQCVLGLSWSCHGLLASVSEDRNAFVWSWDEAEKAWKPCTVYLKAARAANCVAWAPNGRRFAVGISSQDRAVRVCEFAEGFGFWSAKNVGSSKASVSSLAWHPTSNYLAAGSADQQCSVYDVEEGGESFGSALLTEDAGAWVNSAAFSPSGATFAYVPQDSTVRFKRLAGGPHEPAVKVRWSGLPLMQAVFLNEKCLVACGFDYVPVLFRSDGQSWQLGGCIDPGIGASPSSHTNTITQVKPYQVKEHAAGNPRHFSTTGSDGKIIIWEFNAD